MTRYGLPDKAIASLQQLFSTHPQIEQVKLYGSRATGRFRPESDIDLTLIGASLNWPDLAQIENEIDDLLLPWKIDLSLFHLLDNPALRQNIEAQAIVLYQRQ